MNLEQYRQKGGTYVIPCEIIDQLIEKRKEFINSLKLSIMICKLAINDKYIKQDNEILNKWKYQLETYKEVLKKVSDKE